MPAKQSPKKSTSTPAVSDPAEPVADVAGAADAPSIDSAPEQASEPAETAAPVPMNRAERRARGKGGSQPPPHGRGKVAGGKGPVSGARMWSNRRSGG
ncbi:MAG TPA: hypothetical protein VF163_16710 [Micromonosporaceae bacterium]